MKNPWPSVLNAETVSYAQSALAVGFVIVVVYASLQMEAYEHVVNKGGGVCLTKNPFEDFKVDWNVTVDEAQHSDFRWSYAPGALMAAIVLFVFTQSSLVSSASASKKKENGWGLPLCNIIAIMLFSWSLLYPLASLMTHGCAEDIGSFVIDNDLIHAVDWLIFALVFWLLMDISQLPAIVFTNFGKQRLTAKATAKQLEGKTRSVVNLNQMVVKFGKPVIYIILGVYFLLIFDEKTVFLDTAFNPIDNSTYNNTFTRSPTTSAPTKAPSETPPPDHDFSFEGAEYIGCVSGEGSPYYLAVHADVTPVQCRDTCLREEKEVVLFGSDGGCLCGDTDLFTYVNVSEDFCLCGDQDNFTTTNVSLCRFRASGEAPCNRIDHPYFGSALVADDKHSAYCRDVAQDSFSFVNIWDHLVYVLLGGGILLLVLAIADYYMLYGMLLSSWSDRPKALFEMICEMVNIAVSITLVVFVYTLTIANAHGACIFVDVTNEDYREMVMVFTVILCVYFNIRYMQILDSTNAKNRLPFCQGNGIAYINVPQTLSEPLN